MVPHVSLVDRITVLPEITIALPGITVTLSGIMAKFGGPYHRSVQLPV